MKKYPKDFTEMQKMSYDDFFAKVMNLSCKSCKGKLRKIGLWRVECVDCKQQFSVTKPRVLKRGLNNSANWKAKCGECGGQMSYYNFRYGCNRCGHIMEV